MFNQISMDIKTPRTEYKSVDGYRFYFNLDDTCSGPFPSVTTILSVDEEKQKSLAQWRKNVGQKEAERISRISSDRGNRAHEYMEDYIQNLDHRKSLMPDVVDITRQLSEVADKHIDNIRAVELSMWSKHLRVAGTVDLIADFDGELAVIDWKNSLKTKREEWVHDYFMQKSAYAVMFEETTGVPIRKLVTVIGVAMGAPQVFIQDRDNWIDKFKERRRAFDLVRQAQS